MLRGEDVRALQVDLNRLGYACGTADGIFGPKTNAAARAFQREHGSEVDGVVGEKTRAALEEAPEHVGTDAEAEESSDEHGEGATQMAKQSCLRVQKDAHPLGQPMSNFYIPAICYTGFDDNGVSRVLVIN